VARTDLCSDTSASCLLHLTDTLHLSNNTAVQGAGGGVLITNLTRVKGTIFGCLAGSPGFTQCLQKQSSTRRLMQDPEAASDLHRQLNSASGGYGDDIATAATTLTLVPYGEGAGCSSGTPVLDSEQELSIAPGQALQRAFFLRDALGHCVTGSISDANMGLQVNQGSI
jgi:hypothetical protein